MLVLNITVIEFKKGFLHLGPSPHPFVITTVFLLYRKNKSELPKVILFIVSGK